jgi:hypothetical protein
MVLWFILLDRQTGVETDLKIRYHANGYNQALELLDKARMLE